MHFRPAIRRTVLPALILVAILMGGCADAPISLKYDARAAITAAREQRADIYAPEMLESAEAAFRDGIRAMEVESAGWNMARNYGVASARLETAMRRARLSANLSSARQRDYKERTESILRTTRSSMENVTFLLTYLSPRTRARADLMAVRVLTGEARAYADKGDLPRALERADLASHKVALLSESLGRTIGRYTDTEKTGLYRRWIRETVAASEASRSYAILVDKLRHTLTLLKAGRPVRTYRADIGLNGVQDKAVAGDKATPEGRYRIVEKRGPRQTRWYKALLIDYPNDEDRIQFAAAQARGLISKRARIGGLIEIHGEGGRYQDWTEGCVALENDDIDDLFDRVTIGTPVTIVGYESDDWLRSAPASAAARSATNDDEGEKPVAGSRRKMGRS